ncbi:hypothetical protein CEUSTIGMA_g1151.t1 [Chlamydomonas eustigma]|uniref:SUI1 domain-containing protein n=1 Tax=Chlamydomonas eustigma TaxID=1157962 RepID=A0A250WSM7_9CHLO|nr:hypothetical protein CEUSTIGMA_g1151.t1 [Chlamydomonas eustigma]|eukprot:GAX73699.1 hypothetical protein CEUSTIGMA_g1151.t1 [Chlamydomonas eustigma]
MFKKSCLINQRSLLSGSDRKKLRRELEKLFSALGDDGLETLLPNKAGEMEVAKVASPGRTIIYLHDKYPIVVDISGKGDLYPTIFGLWRYPATLPQVKVKHPFVTQYLVNGADLMLPGVDISCLPEFSKGDLVSICVHGNPLPLAVGTAGMSSADARSKAVPGVKGKLVAVLQGYGDCLWSELGGRLVPNNGFLPTAVVPIGSSLEAVLRADGDEGHSLGDEEEEGIREGGEETAVVPATEAAGLMPALQSLELGSFTSAAATGTALGACETAAPGDMEALLELTLLQALSRAVKDSDLPLAGSVLWAQHMLACRPAGSVLDIKKSKHKKMSKFLQCYGGKGGLLTLKEDKHSGDIILTSINRSHLLLINFRPMPARATEAGSSSSVAEPITSEGGMPCLGFTTGNSNSSRAAHGGVTAIEGAGACGVSSSPSELSVEELWRAGRELRGVLEALGVSTDSMFTEKEAGQVAFDYVKHAKLEENSPDPTMIVLDATLCDALFKGLIKKGETYPTHLSKADLRDCFLKRCQAQYRISRGSEQVVKKGSAPTITVSAEKTRGHRVTRIVGVEHFMMSAEQVASDCQKKFACSTSVNELPGKNQGSEVLIQGHLEGVSEFLSKAYGVPKKFIK